MTRLKNLLSKVLYALGLGILHYTITFSGGNTGDSNKSLGSKCCTFVLMLPFNKVSRTLSSCSMFLIVIQKGVYVSKKWNNNQLILSCQFLDTIVTKLAFVTNYPISCQLMVGIIFGYPLSGQFDII